MTKRRYVAPQGKQTSRVQASGYGNAGASYARKSLVAWKASGTAPDDDIVRNLRTLRARSRDLYMSSPLAAGALKTIRTNVVGSGLMLHAHVDREVLGLTAEQANSWEQAVEREWHLFADTVSCDAQRMQTFYQLQSLVLLSTLMSGDCFVALPFIRTGSDPYQLKIDIIEGDRICNPDYGIGLYKDNILEGVEVGKYGEPVAYYVAKFHPGLSAIPAGERQEWKRIPAFGAKSGRRNLLHIMELERPGQRRGVPVFASVIEALKQLSRYTDSELMAAVIASYFTVFLKHDAPDNIMGAQGADLQTQDLASDLDGVTLTNGGLVELPEGYDISIANPQRPNSLFGQFIESICRQVGSAIEIPYELLMKSFTASYSASRGALLEAWKMFRMRRQWLVDQFCQPVYEEWLAEAVAVGRIEAPGFFSDPVLHKAWCMTEWAGDTQGQLDPLKEANAAIARINANLSTREREAAELTGMDFNVIAAENARENALLTKLGLGGELAFAPDSREDEGKGSKEDEDDTNQDQSSGQ